MGDQDDEFADFVRSRMAALRRTAFLLCGDWHKAEDLVQNALLKAFRAWARVRPGEQDAYVRKVLVRVAIDDSRRFWHRETAAGDLPDTPTSVVDTDESMDVRRALAALPVRQRAAVVLRYWEDLPVEEVGRLLGCAPGTVKSQCAKGLATLRRTLLVLEETE
ncbi:SigE family RNA polymerase sigma factor [Actinocrispum sp. NPDC049592]|uniref:SigE family RNA polymerase sigma factor n=1 Tax=Actinocrispum sp. NPDC049592 TaxID=3154835 RepID=UPI00342524C1